MQILTKFDAKKSPAIPHKGISIFAVPETTLCLYLFSTVHQSYTESMQSQSRSRHLKLFSHHRNRSVLLDVTNNGSVIISASGPT